MTILSTAHDVATLRASVGLFIDAALARMAGSQGIGVVNVPAPLAPLTAFLAALPRDMSFAWHNPPSGLSCAGAGVTATIRVSGADRLAQLRHSSDRLWRDITVEQHPDAPAYAPRLAGGLAFASGGSQSAPWCEFGDGAFSLARWTYGRADGRAFLSLAVPCGADTNQRGRRCALDEYERLLEALAAAPALQAPLLGEEPPPMPATLSQMSPADWEEYIQRIHEALADGSFLKIVAARRCDVALGAGVADLSVFERLSTEPKCTAFAFRRDRSAFVGASPELLFLKTGAALRTQALAGTARSARDPLNDHLSAELLGSSKDRSEHEHVVRAIREALVPLCTQVSVAREPEVLALRNIIHINTPFVAHVRETTHVADLLGALHPTPAVGGVPGPEARAWIVENERQERGWYTGPVGWFDSRGDAEFAVAIRCGVIDGRQAHLYTGAGVVGDSHHAAEYAETALKQLPMLRALGIRET